MTGSRVSGVAVAAAVALALGGCGSTSSTSGAAAPGASLSPLQQAARDAAQMLVTVQFPAGSRRSTAEPLGGSALVAKPPSVHGPLPPPGASGGVYMQLQKPPAGTTAAVASSWWVAPGSVDSLVSWITQHSPAGIEYTTEQVSGSASAAVGRGSHGAGQTTSEEVDFTISPAGHYELREILIGMVPGPRGTVVARVEAQSAWSPSLSRVAQVAGRIVTMKRCLTTEGLRVLGGGPAQSTKAGGPVGEVLVSSTDTRGPVFIAVFATAAAADASMRVLAASAKRIGGLALPDGAEVVIYPHPPTGSLPSQLGGCLH